MSPLLIFNFTLHELQFRVLLDPISHFLGPGRPKFPFVESDQFWEERKPIYKSMEAEKSINIH